MSIHKSAKLKYHANVDMEKYILAIKNKKLVKSQHEEGIQKLTSKLEGKMVIVEVTVKAAEFVIGPGGTYLLKIENRTGARLLSTIPEESSCMHSKYATHRIEITGAQNKCKKALDIIVAAVDLYKQIQKKYNLKSRQQQQHQFNLPANQSPLQRTQSIPARKHAFVNQPLSFPSLSFGRAV